MQNQNTKTENLKRKAKGYSLKLKTFEFYTMVLCFSLLLFSFLPGCSVVEYLSPEEPPYKEQLSESYYRTKLKQSSSADVLAAIAPAPPEGVPERTAADWGETQLLSRSKSVIASSGQKKKGHEIWLNMVAFDENELAARRKYFFLVDERPKVLFVEPRENLSFDCEMVLEPDVLDEPYANDNAKRIAVLRRVLANVRRDVDEVAGDNKTAGICGMLINQALETVLVRLDSSPVSALKLSESEGLQFSHISFDKGKIRMALEDDIVTVRMRLGSLVYKFEQQQGI